VSLSGAEASIAFAAVQPETRQAIEAALPTLKNMLAEHGLSLTQGSVSDQAPQRDGDRTANGNGARSGSSSTGRSDDTGASITTAATSTTRRVTRAGGVDLYA